MWASGNSFRAIAPCREKIVTPSPHSLRSVCVFCGARPGNDLTYIKAAQATGAMIAHQGWRLVYGAGDVGLMGEVARAAQTAGAQTLGVIPQHLMSREIGKRDLTSLIVTQDMHTRKHVMFTNSDAIVVLPGGAGSLDEFFEVLTWAQIGLHDKPICLLNVAGYWDPLIDLIHHIVAKGFADPSIRSLFQVAPDVDALQRLLQTSMAR
jgi:uncharacterized protein (TIGR00730 family)